MAALGQAGGEQLLREERVAVGTAVQRRHELVRGHRAQDALDETGDLAARRRARARGASGGRSGRPRPATAGADDAGGARRCDTSSAAPPARCGRPGGWTTSRPACRRRPSGCPRARPAPGTEPTAVPAGRTGRRGCAPAPIGPGSVRHPGVAARAPAGRGPRRPCRRRPAPRPADVARPRAQQVGIGTERQPALAHVEAAADEHLPAGLAQPIAATSAASRDLPTPASPATRMCDACPSAVSASARWRRSSSSARPMNSGLVTRLVTSPIIASAVRQVATTTAGGRAPRRESRCAALRQPRRPGPPAVRGGSTGAVVRAPTGQRATGLPRHAGRPDGCWR